MESKEIIRHELERAGLAVDDDVLERLVPMYQRWQGLLSETREIDIRPDEPPAFISTGKI